MRRTQGRAIMYGPLRKRLTSLFKCSSAWRQGTAAHDPRPCHLFGLDHVPSVGSLEDAVKHGHGHLRNWEPTWLRWQKNGRNLLFWVIFVLVTDQLRKNWSHEASLYLILEKRKLRKMVMITWGQHCLWGRGRRLSRRRAALTGKALRALGREGHPGQLAQGFGLLSTGTRSSPGALPDLLMVQGGERPSQLPQ